MRTLEDIIKELNAKGLTKKHIDLYFDIIIYIYVGQNIRSEGILQKDNYFKEKEDHLKILYQYEIISHHKWYSLELIQLTNFGLEIGELIIQKELNEKKDKISKDLEKYPQLLIGFLVHNYLSEDLVYYIEEENLWDWRDLILGDSRVKKIINRIFSDFEKQKLCVITRDYVSTRGGEVRGRAYVISPEIRRLLLEYYPRDGLSSDDKINCKVANILQNKTELANRGDTCSISNDELRKTGGFDSAHTFIKTFLEGIAEEGIIKNLRFFIGGLNFTIVEKENIDELIIELIEEKIEKLLGPEIFFEIDEGFEEGFLEQNLWLMKELIENKVKLYRLIAQLSHGKNMFNSNPNTELFGLQLIEEIEVEEDLKRFIVNLHQFVIECSSNQILRFIDNKEYWNRKKGESAEISPKEFMSLVEEIDDEKIKFYEEARETFKNLHNLRNHYSHLQDAKTLYESSLIFKKLVNMSFPTSEEDMLKVQEALLDRTNTALGNLYEVFSDVLSKRK